jgi:hypothetical protein
VYWLSPLSPKRISGQLSAPGARGNRSIVVVHGDDLPTAQCEPVVGATVTARAVVQIGLYAKHILKLDLAEQTLAVLLLAAGAGWIGLVAAVT